ncbi:hypothetical protein KFE25_006894 [Diacronema lutheri]|uniref:Phytanoyl-CoA dioxygenase n=1 Tax=Diacronema lutheri TaxID=2081491 RepID=A0A8J6CAN7_DIALT|nr:hypothetical protein KFE25_006894 [Diacronema lutheri]
MAAGENGAGKVEWRIRITPEEVRARELTACSIARAGRSLRENGCVLLAPALVRHELCVAASERAVADLRLLLQRAARTYPGRDPLRDRIYSAELCNRTDHGRRYDVRIDAALCGPPWREIFDAAREFTRPVLREAAILGDDAGAGRVYTAGCVTSLAGGVAQGFHRDGDEPGCVNVFCPLVNVDAANGPTELIVGSHLWSRQQAAEVAALAEGDSAFAARARVVRASAERGALLLFDFRTLHRGARHPPTLERDEGFDAPARPVLYAVAARPGVVAWDFFDHPSLSP